MPCMGDDDEIDLFGELNATLRQAHDEVVSLRARVDALEPKAHAYETLAQFARLTVPREEQGYGIDVAWRIKTAVEKLQEAIAAKRNAGAAQVER